MKNRFSSQTSLPLLYNLGFQRQKKPALLPWENFSYTRINETLENPIRKSLRLTEFVTFFWSILNSGAQIVIINNDEQQAFSYENWFEGNGIKCYEGPWVPGLWSNPLLMNPTPDLVILRSVNKNERDNIMSELKSLRLPIINFSSENLENDQFPISTSNEPPIIHFYMELIRFLFLHFQQQSTSRYSLLPNTNSPSFYSELYSFTSELVSHPVYHSFTQLWLHHRIFLKKNLKNGYPQKNLISSKKSYISKNLTAAQYLKTIKKFTPRRTKLNH